VRRVMDPAGGTDSLRLHPGLVLDLGWQADLFCEYRPQLAADGFERVGIFVRDQAAGAFDGTMSQQGACYALTWDSGDGRVRCLRVHGGALTDLLPVPRFAPGSAWRRFRIEAVGNALTFLLDGERLLQTNDNTYAGGDFGIGYHEFFATNGNMHGTRVDSCHADVPGAFVLRLQPGLLPGDLHVRRSRGIPGDPYFTALTKLPGAFPYGWFFGLDPAWNDLLAFAGSANPVFLGVLDADGGHDVALHGVPIGMQLQGVGLDLDPSLRWLQASAPVQVTAR
jgi:hypothetical protein